MKKHNSACYKCGIDAWDIGEDFYVKDILWRLITPSEKRKEVICIGCFEQQLGRRLTLKDFAKWFRKNRCWGDRRKKLNNPPSLRLCDRMKIKA